VKTESGYEIRSRALLDNCSQLNFITDRLAKKLTLKRVRDPLLVNCLNGTKTKAEDKVSLRIIASGRVISVSAHVGPEIAAKLRLLPQASIGMKPISPWQRK
jgi:hypothetical protein